MNKYDVIIVGGGHNGLVCSCYLAKAKLKVLVLERRSVVGGAAVTEEFHPGFRNSVASYTVSLLNPKVIQDLHLEHHGLKILLRPYSNFMPMPDNDYLRTAVCLEETQEQFARFSIKDAKVLPDYYAMLETVADVLRASLLETPPNVGGGVRDLLHAARLANRVRKLRLPQGRDLLALFTCSAAEILDDWFESDAVKAVFGFDAVVGNFASPYSSGSAYVLLHHVFGEANGQRGEWGHAVGGMGAITQAMLREAESLGVTVKTEAAVAEVMTKAGAAVGVRLENGEEFQAGCVASNLNPSLLYNRLIDPNELPEEFLTAMRRYKNGSGTFRINVALSELPEFTVATEDVKDSYRSSGIIIAPSLRYMEQAFFDARQFGWAKQPIIEMLIPSTIDDSLAPRGKHVASLFCQQFNPQLPDGRSWDDVKDQATETIFDTVNRHAPNFKASILGQQVLSPLDLERTFGLIGGDIFHGHLSLDQLFSARPLLGYGDYRGPLKGLYMCGSGTHPGGGVTGAPGHNAAREILHDFRFGKLSRGA